MGSILPPPSLPSWSLRSALTARRPSSAVAVVVGTAIGIGLGVWHVSGRSGWPLSPRPYTSPSKDLEVDPASLDFGRVDTRHDFPWHVEIKNNTAVPIIFDRFTASCTCTEIRPSVLTVPTNGTASVSLVLDLARDVDGDLSKWTPFQVAITATSGGPSPRSLTWVVQGESRPAVTVSSGIFDLGEVLVGDPVPTASTVVRLGADVETVEAIAADPDMFDCLVENNDARSRVVYVSAKPAALQSVGRLESRVDLFAVRAGQRSSIVVATVPVFGAVVPVVKALPESLQVGPTSVGQEFEEQICLVTRTGAAMRLTQTRASVPGIETTVAAPSNPRSDTVLIAIHGRVERLGTFHADVTFHLAVDGQIVPISVPIALTGIE